MDRRIAEALPDRVELLAENLGHARRMWTFFITNRGKGSSGSPPTARPVRRLGHLQMGVVQAIAVVALEDPDEVRVAHDLHGQRQATPSMVTSSCVGPTPPR